MWRFARFLSAAVIAVWALPGAVVVSASGQGCPDVDVVFARGTGEAPGLGPTGQAFVDHLRSRVGANSVGVTAVNYPASDDWAASAIDGITYAGNHVLATANSCPKTKMVLSGYSQGAAVMGFVTSPAVPDGIDPASVPKPLQPEVADHVAAVVLFGTPNVRAMDFLGQPPVVIGPLYAAKTIKVCAFDDPVCSDGLNFAAHDSYAGDASMVGKGAAFAAERLGARAAQNMAPPAPGAPPAWDIAPSAPPPAGAPPLDEPDQAPTAA